MVAQEFIDPIPHVVIDNFFGSKVNQTILQLIEDHLPQFSAGEVQNNGNIELNTKYKRNGNLWLDSFDSSIVNFFRNNFFNFSIRNNELNHANRMHEVLLSQYVNGDFYDWHTDLGGSVTWNYFIFKEPRQFNGGEFCLSDALIYETINNRTVKEIDLLNDRLVIFPAKYQHKVKQVQSIWAQPMSNRFTIQVFFR
jgi:hypothetical protein